MAIFFIFPSFPGWARTHFRRKPPKLIVVHSRNFGKGKFTRETLSAALAAPLGVDSFGDGIRCTPIAELRRTKKPENTECCPYSCPETIVTFVSEATGREFLIDVSHSLKLS